MHALCKNNVASVHAPFLSLNLGSKDKFIREYSKRRILEGINIAKLLRAKEYIIHSTFFPLVPKKVFDTWIKLAWPSFEEIFAECKKAEILALVENTYEKDTLLHEKIFSDFKDIGFCLDVGHINCFSDATLDNWLDKFSNKLTALHLHDNIRLSDDHLDLGDGNIDLKKIIEKVIILSKTKNIRLNLETKIENFTKNTSRLKELLS